MWRALLKLLKSVFPNAVVQLSSLIPPQGEHPLRKTVAASNAALVKACHSEQVMLADHTDTFTTNSGAPRKALYRDALHPSPKGTVRLACNVKYMYVGQTRPPLRPQERPSHPSPSASGRVPLLETPSFQPRFDCPPSQHPREGGGTEMGQLFQPLAVLSHHLHCYNNGLRTRKTPSHNDGLVTPHYTISLTATAEEHPNTVMSAPLRHPSVAGTEHIGTLSAGGPRQLLGGCSGDTCVTQAGSVCPAVCFNGSLFLYTPDWCVLVAWMRACVCARSCTRTTYISWYECVTLTL